MCILIHLWMFPNEKINILLCVSFKHLPCKTDRYIMAKNSFGWLFWFYNFLKTPTNIYWLHVFIHNFKKIKTLIKRPHALKILNWKIKYLIGNKTSKLQITVLGFVSKMWKIMFCILITEIIIYLLSCAQLSEMLLYVFCFVTLVQ